MKIEYHWGHIHHIPETVFESGWIAHHFHDDMQRPCWIGKFEGRSGVVVPDVFPHDTMEETQQQPAHPVKPWS